MTGRECHSAPANTTISGMWHDRAGMRRPMALRDGCGGRPIGAPWGRTPTRCAGPPDAAGVKVKGGHEMRHPARAELLLGLALAALVATAILRTQAQPVNAQPINPTTAQPTAP